MDTNMVIDVVMDMGMGTLLGRGPVGGAFALCTWHTRGRKRTVGRCTPHASSTACGVVACFAAISTTTVSSMSGGEAWKAFIAFCAPPIDE